MSYKFLGIYLPTRIQPPLGRKEAEYCFYLGG
jgi:hypothetical protein